MVPAHGAVPLKRFLAGMEQALNASLRLHPYPTYAKARWSLEEQRVFAVLQVRGRGVRMDVASAAGATVAQVLGQAAGKVGRVSGVPVTVKDVKPLQPGDPRGLAVFYISLAATIFGFFGAIQLSVNAAALNPAERIAFMIAYALLGGFTIAVIVDQGLGALRLPFPESWAILALTMFTSGLVFSMFNVLFGRWALIPTWGLMVLLGNPSSGGAVSWPCSPPSSARSAAGSRRAPRSTPSTLRSTSAPTSTPFRSWCWWRGVWCPPWSSGPGATATRADGRRGRRRRGAEVFLGVSGGPCRLRRAPPLPAPSRNRGGAPAPGPGLRRVARRTPRHTGTRAHEKVPPLRSGEGLLYRAPSRPCTYIPRLETSIFP
ncbi:hypothetical protein SVIO_059680 [Streptomyces violaceusniger]|uniref:Uncharacterized protein n=1 Tax=Streptomyces violaceusniger TaxID=68280 RepID=A0A4D4L2L2_STRVO|nr:hypothetical protein SVIO_059680 [Streptomyces violaceusniger]